MGVLMLRVDQVKVSAVWLAMILWVGFSMLAGVAGWAFGPVAFVETEMGSAYACDTSLLRGGRPHTWNPSRCSGVQMGLGQVLRIEDGRVALEEMSRFFAVVLQPWPLTNASSANVTLPYNEEGFDTTLQVEVSVWGTTAEKASEGDETAWVEVRRAEVTEQEVVCIPESEAGGEPPCSEIMVVLEDYVTYRHYRIELRLPDADNRQFVGDMGYYMAWGNPAFAKMQTILRFIFSGLVLILVILFARQVRQAVRRREFAWEQRAVAMLLPALLLLNNPLYALQFAPGTAGDIWGVVHGICQTVFASVILLFWLLGADYLRQAGSSDASMAQAAQTHGGLRHPRDWLKPAAVLLYFGLSLVVFVWSARLDRTDPIIGLRTTPDILYGFMYAAIAVLAIIIVAIMTILGIGFPQVIRGVQQNHMRGTAGSAATGSGDDVDDDDDDDDADDDEDTSASAAAAAAAGAGAGGGLATQDLTQQRQRLTWSQLCRSLPVMRFVFFAFPTMFVLITFALGMAGGTFLALGETSISYIYFNTLANFYVVLLMWGWAPIDSAPGAPGSDSVRRRLRAAARGVFSARRSFDAASTNSEPLSTYADEETPLYGSAAGR